MTAILFFEMAHHDMGPNEQKLLFGREFANLGQERRVDVLKAKELIDDQQVASFGNIRALRRKHLHFIDEPSPTERECLQAYRGAYYLFATPVKRVGASGTEYRREFLDHLRRKGAIQIMEMEAVPSVSNPGGAASS